jgi:hypothetical protein
MDGLVSSFGFKFNLRRYTLGQGIGVSLFDDGVLAGADTRSHFSST